MGSINLHKVKVEGLGRFEGSNLKLEASGPWDALRIDSRSLAAGENSEHLKCAKP